MNTKYVVVRPATCPLTHKKVVDGKDGFRVNSIDHGNYKIFSNDVLKKGALEKLTDGNADKVLNKTGVETDVAYQVEMVIPYNLHTVLQLAFYNWQIEKVGDTVKLVSFKACKLQALSKHIDGLKVSSIRVNRINYVDNIVLNSFNALNKDVIKECQKLDKIKAMTNREDKPQKHVLSK